MKSTMMMLFACLVVSACSPKVGSDVWCENMEEKDKGDWSMNEAGDYAKHCVIR